MKEPKIVFCGNNHIYDAAIHAECPYCTKIAREQTKLENLVGGSAAGVYSRKYEKRDEIGELVQSKGDTEEATELLRFGEDTEEATELLRFREGTDEAGEHVRSEEDTDEATELLRFGEREDEITELQRRESEKTESAESDRNETRQERYLRGWLVFYNGSFKRRSLELYDLNHISISKAGVTNSERDEEGEVFTLHRSSLDGKCHLSPFRQGECRINGEAVYREETVNSYDVISVCGIDMVFVELMISLEKREV